MAPMFTMALFSENVMPILSSADLLPVYLITWSGGIIMFRMDKKQNLSKQSVETDTTKDNPGLDALIWAIDHNIRDWSKPGLEMYPEEERAEIQAFMDMIAKEKGL